ncbi:hypothetical protein GCM10017668_49520 [Streptomyces tuirus]|uniref:Uncharacterized protein n=1 Tax=Streptomyces tuirus TaxID=68278 RepID=A0A7G1NJX1_9ACTN|nr:hypothetical protein GCM10017668_49520 [Streptomyces tuirus]
MVAENTAAQIAAVRPPARRRRRSRVRAMVRVPLLDSAYGRRAEPRAAGAGRYATGSLSWRVKHHKDAYGCGIGHIRGWCGSGRSGVGWRSLSGAGADAGTVIGDVVEALRNPANAPRWNP